MLQSALFVLFFLLIGSSFSSLIFANPLINEFSSTTSDDWVELYNPTEQAVALSEYELRDEAATAKELVGVLSPHSLFVIEWGNRLGNNGDTFRIVRKVDNEQVDSISYGDDSLHSPEGSQTAGRKIDGHSEWVVFESATKGTSNIAAVFNTPTPTMTPTPTPEPTSTPTKTPTPIKTPTPTRTPTPSKAVVSITRTSSEKSQNELVLSDSDTVQSENDRDVKLGEKNFPTAVLAAKVSEVSKEKETPKSLVKGETATFLPQSLTLVTISLGAVLLVICGIIFFLNWKKSKEST